MSRPLSQQALKTFNLLAYSALVESLRDLRQGRVRPEDVASQRAFIAQLRLALAELKGEDAQI